MVPELGWELGEDLGIGGHVEISDGFALPFRERRHEFDIVMLEDTETETVSIRFHE